MRAMRTLVLLLGALLLNTAGAAQGWQVEAGAGVEHADNDSSDWQQFDLALRSRFAPRSVAELTTRHTRRHGYDDHEIGAGLALPLGGDWSLAASATASPSHRVLARASGRVDLARAFEGGWVLSAGVGRSLFDGVGTGKSGSSNWRLSGERYVGDWRLMAGLVRTRLDGGQTDGGGLLQVDRYVGERGRVGVFYARGRELENVPELAGVVSTRVDTYGLLTIWPLSTDWALVGSIGRSRNSDRVLRTGPGAGGAAGADYRRDGIRLGVQHDF